MESIVSLSIDPFLVLFDLSSLSLTQLGDTPSPSLLEYRVEDLVSILHWEGIYLSSCLSMCVFLSIPCLSLHHDFVILCLSVCVLPFLEWKFLLLHFMVILSLFHCLVNFSFHPQDETEMSKLKAFPHWDCHQSCRLPLPAIRSCRGTSRRPQFETVLDWQPRLMMINEVFVKKKSSDDDLPLMSSHLIFQISFSFDWKNWYTETLDSQNSLHHHRIGKRFHTLFFFFFVQLYCTNFGQKETLCACSETADKSNLSALDRSLILLDVSSIFDV